MATHSAVYEVHLYTNGRTVSLDEMAGRTLRALAAEFAPERNSRTNFGVAVHFAGRSYPPEKRQAWSASTLRMAVADQA